MSKNIRKQKFDTLIKKIGRGNKRALEEFYAEYGKFLYVTALSFCQDRFSAEEVVDDILVKIWNLASDAPNVEYPMGWLYTVAKNAALNKRNKTLTTELCDTVANPENGVDRAMDEPVFLSYLEILEEDEKEILIEKFLSNATFAEIAESLRCPTSTVSSKYYRALEKIKKNFFKNA